MAGGWGKRPAGGEIERVTALHWDTVIIAPGAKLINTKLFQKTDKPERLQNFDINTTSCNKNVQYQFLYLDMDLEFTNVASQHDYSQLLYFLTNSKVNIKKNNKIYNPIPLSELVPYSIVNLNGTYDKVVKPFFLGYEYPDQEEGLRLPEDAQIEIDLEVAPSLVAAIAGVTNPLIYSANVPAIASDDKGYSLRFTHKGSQNESAS